MDGDLHDQRPPMSGLGWLLPLVERGIISHVRVTLTLSGLVVSGTMVTTKDWYTGLATDMRAKRSGAAESTTHFATALDQFARSLADSATGYRGFAYLSLLEEPRPGVYVHLTNAVVYAPSGPLRVGYWYGLASAVVGFAFGQPTTGT